MTACFPMSASGTISPRAPLTFQQPLGDAEGSHQVLGNIQVGRLLAKLGEALSQNTLVFFNFWISHVKCFFVGLFFLTGCMYLLIPSKAGCVDI